MPGNKVLTTLLTMALELLVALILRDSKIKLLLLSVLMNLCSFVFVKLLF